MSARDIRPAVAPPRDPLPLPVILGLAMLLGIGLFVGMGARRAAPAVSTAQPMLSEPPPPLVLPSPVVSAAPPAPVVRIVPARAAPQPVVMALPYRPVAYDPPAAHPIAPMRAAGNRQEALVIDNTAGQGVTIAGVQGQATSSEETARAVLIPGRATTIAQGTIIAATLETPLNSDRPGLARALVNADVRGFDGTRVLIPRGSRLIGEFKPDAGAGKRRVMVTWNRLIRPDGVAIRIASPASDAMGGAGIAGRVNTHALENIGHAVLQSALTLGVNVATAQISRAGTALYLGVQGFAPPSAQAGGRPATVKVGEGAAIAVLVARDLDFAGMPGLR